MFLSTGVRAVHVCMRVCVRERESYTCVWASERASERAERERERERERQTDRQTDTDTDTDRQTETQRETQRDRDRELCIPCVSSHASVCACVCERARERGHGGGQIIVSCGHYNNENVSYDRGVFIITVNSK